MKPGINRRQFMQHSLIGAAATPLLLHTIGHEAEALTQAVSPNDRIQMGIIGVGSRVQSGVMQAAMARTAKRAARLRAMRAFRRSSWRT